jgi:DNA-binding winged helix-turn-helix (wHTH) protein
MKTRTMLFAALAVAHQAIADNAKMGFGVFEEGSHKFKIGKNTFHGNGVPAQDYDLPSSTVEEDPKFADPKNGDFTVGAKADDYVVKPFSILELVAHVKAVLNRTRPRSDIETLNVGDARINFSKLTVESNGSTGEISRYEADILRLLASDPGRVFSRENILDQVWGMEAFPSNRTVDNYIVKLRQKIEPAPKEPRHILSIYGKGYKLVARERLRAF